MMLLGSIGTLGFSTLLISELPRHKEKRPLITTALLIVGLTGLLLGAAFAGLAPFLSEDLRPLASSPFTTGLFMLGVGFTSITIVLDQAIIGLLRGGLQLGRNTLFAAGKLLLLWLAALWVLNKTGMTIYATWVLGSFTSILFVSFVALRQRPTLRAFRPNWQLIHKLRRKALGHHALNLTLQGPSQLLPLLTTILLSATINAYFYTAWMMARFLFVVPISLTVVLHAIGSADPAALARKMRQTLLISAAVGVAANLVLLPGANLILTIFGAEYASEASNALRVLALGVFPLIIRYHYIALARIHNYVGRAAWLMGFGGLLELGLAALGANMAGLTGLAIGWVIAVSVEAILMAKAVMETAVSPQQPAILSGD